MVIFHCYVSSPEGKPPFIKIIELFFHRVTSHDVTKAARKAAPASDQICPKPSPCAGRSASLGRSKATFTGLRQHPIAIHIYIYIFMYIYIYIIYIYIVYIYIYIMCIYIYIWSHTNTHICKQKCIWHMWHYIRPLRHSITRQHITSHHNTLHHTTTHYMINIITWHSTALQRHYSTLHYTTLHYIDWHNSTYPLVI